MTRIELIANISKFPNAQGSSYVRYTGHHPTHEMEDLSAYGQAHAEALAKAIAAFAEKYNRYPEWDILRFRGGYTTFKVLVEIWEEL